MNRTQALPYVSFYVDDALNAGRVDNLVGGINAIPANARLVGYQCGFEPLFVAVWSYLPGITLSEEDAEDLACDYLSERGWFRSGSDQDRSATVIL